MTLRIGNGAVFAALLVSVAVADTGEDLWKDFRKAYPFHAQEIGVSADGRYVLVAEPPPTVTAPQIAEVLGATHQRTFRHPLGYDGWVADVVLDLPALPEPQLRERLVQVAVLLHGTAYRGEFVKLPVEAPVPARVDNLDVRVGADDLRRWLFDESMELVPDIGGPFTTAARLAAEGGAGVYISDPLGLVIWALPRSGELEHLEPEARRWGMAADLVLGGVQGKQSVLVVGRARQVPVAEFPPLRTEEIVNLLSVRTAHLAQSYERTHILAGRWKGTPYHDWAPILLSAELLDTEYGSLLNITDQLLKSWSQLGNTEYVRFDYPRPEKYPFSKPLSVLVARPTVTFNWNTAGVGHITRYADGTSIFALNRTGALPVSYIPEGLEDDDDQLSDVASLEETAYEYFAARNNAHLARVVQYAALYEIFVAFQLHVDRPHAVAIPAAGRKVFHAVLERTLRMVAQAKPEQVEDLAKQVLDAVLRVDPEAGAEESRDELTSGLKADLLLFREHLQELTAKLGDRVIPEIADALVQGRPDEATIARLVPIEAQMVSDEEIPEDDVRLYIVWTVAQLISDPDLPFRDFVAALADVDEVMSGYAKAFQAARKPTWICTASIVQSRDAQNVSIIGGHNLDAEAGIFVVDPSVPRGKPILMPDGKSLRIHPEDANGMGAAWRRIARSASPADDLPELFAAGRKEIEQLPRAMPARLKVAATAPGAETPPSGRVSFGSRPLRAHREPHSTFPGRPDQRVVVFIDRAGTGTSDGRTFFTAREVGAKVDEVLTRIREWKLQEGTTVDVLVEGDALTSPELAAFAANFRARRPRGVSIRVQRAVMSGLDALDLRTATIGNVREALVDGVHPGQKLTQYTCELAINQSKPLVIRAYSRVAGAAARVKEIIQAVIQELKSLGKPVTLEALEKRMRIQLEDLLEGVEFELEVPRGSQEDGILFTDATCNDGAASPGRAA